MPGNCPASLRPTAARLWKTFRSKLNAIPVIGENCSLSPRNRVHLHTGMLFGITTECCSASERNRVHLRPDSPAVANLDERQSAHLVGVRFRAQLFSQGERFQNSALNKAKRPSARPRHTFEKSTTIDAVVVMIMLDKSIWVRIKTFCLCHGVFLLNHRGPLPRSERAVTGSGKDRRRPSRRMPKRATAALTSRGQGLFHGKYFLCEQKQGNEQQ